MSQQFNLGVDLIVAGMDLTGAHISAVINPGTSVSLDKLGYGAVGSGGIHATISLSLNGQTSRKGLTETLYGVYAAKKSSEVAPGVGQETDIAIIEVGKIFRCGVSILNALKDALDSSKSKTPDFAKIEESYNEQHKA
jgi:hypothetical protein